MHAACFNYPTKLDQPKRKLANMLTSYKQSVSTMNSPTSAQESATAASLQVSWTLTKAKKPFADAELSSKCAVEMATEVLSHDEKKKKAMVELLKQVAKLSGEMQEVMDTMSRFINFVRESSSLQHCLLESTAGGHVS